MSRQALFVLPAGDRILQTLFRIVRKEIADVGVVFELPADFRLSALSFRLNPIIRRNRIGVGLSGICLQPFLKGHIEGKNAFRFFA